MLLANYASDSDSDNEDLSKAGPSTIPQKNLPPPRPAVIQSNASVKKRKGPVKITLELPKSKNTAGDDEDVDASVSDEDKDLSSKKPKFNIKGKGSSALLGMLPPPKRKLPTSTTRSSSLAVNKSMATPRPKVSSDTPDMGGLSASDIAAAATSSLGDGEDANEDGGMMLPPSLRGKAKPKAEPAVDLFGLSSVLTPIPSSSKTPIPPTISSAPAAPDFIPPIPSPEDPYPGYYQTPSGEWKAYDPKYYASFFAPETKLQGEEHDDGRVGRHWEEFDTKGADLLDVDVSSSLKAARAEEERKNLIKKPKMPGDEYEYQAIGQTKGLAAQRHQLTSLLHNAYSSREELEERIAQNKKNMRLAGQKYGF